MIRPASPAVRGPVAAVFGLLVAAAVIPALVPLLPGGRLLRTGDIAPRTLVAQRDAEFKNGALTEAARENAATAVEPAYLDADAAVLTQQEAALDTLIEDVRVIRGQGLTASEQLQAIEDLPSARAVAAGGRAGFIFLDAPTYDSVAVAARTALAAILEDGVRDGTETESTQSYMDEHGDAVAGSQALSVLEDLLGAFVVANVKIDEAETDRLREEARNRVPPVIVVLTAGQVVVNEGDTLDAETIEALRATGIVNEGFDYGQAVAGILAGVAFGLVMGFAVWAIQPFPAPAARRLLLAGGSAAAVVLAGRFVLPLLVPDTDGHFLAYAMPVAIAAMLAASVGNFAIGGVVAFAVSIILVFAVATLTALPGAAFGDTTEALRLTAAYSAAGVAGAACMASAERMRRVAFAAATITGATAVVLMLFWLTSVPRDNEELGWIALMSAISGLASSVSGTGLFVLLALVLGIPTRLQLFELAQADHPLMRRLQDEAPGTYHHSLMVGTLAERAAAKIGADTLLARVGAYYHDIGKLKKPDHFIENMLDPAETPHKQLSPAESADVIRAHVTAGIELARRARLPAAVRSFIPEHHGTRLVTYFYRQAAQDGGTPDPAQFRYPGPRPATRESAIVMLADSCEAVVRASDDHTPESMDEIVESVVAERLSEGQFNDCEITLKELQVIGQTFKSTLRAVYHPRIPYPQPAPEELAAIAGGEPSPTATDSGPTTTGSSSQR